MATPKPPDPTPPLLPLPTTHSPSLLPIFSLPSPSSPSFLPPLLPNPSISPLPSSSSVPPLLSNSSPSTCTGYTWASRVSASRRSLSKISDPLSFPPSSKPRVKIPNSIFLKGEIYHRDFIIGLFYGENPPPPGKVFGVLNHIWGKEVTLEIHRLTAWAYLIRVPSESLRRRILLKELWMIGDSLLYTGKWKPEYSLHPPTIEIAPIWVHLTGLPFDLITREGLSYVGSLLGDPIDVDDFTKRIRSHHEAHIKVEIDLTKPLPDSLEIEKEDGDIITVAVAFPHLPPLCEVCKKFGHKVKQCPSSNFQWVPKQAPSDIAGSKSTAQTLSTVNGSDSTASKEIGSKSTTYPDTQGQSNKPPTNTLDTPQVECAEAEAVNVPSQAGIEPVPSQYPVTPAQEGSNSLVHGSASTEEGEIIASAQEILRARLHSPCSVNARKTMGKKKRKPLIKSLSLFKFTDYG